MSSCSTMAGPVLLEQQRKHALKIRQSDSEELGECPIQDRIVAYRAFGKGHPLLFIPGSLNSRLFQPAFENSVKIASESGFRVVVVDRPGYGLSTGPVVRSYSEFAEVVDKFTDSVGLDKFAMMGFSSGGPYALSCAANLRHKVTALVLVAADGEYANPELGIEFSQIYKAFTREDFLTRGLEVAKEIADSSIAQYKETKNPQKREMVLQDLYESIRVGFDGTAQDRVLETQRWNIPIPPKFEFPIHIYHGTEDHDVPIKCAHWYHELLKPSELIVIEGENHSMIRRQFGRILQHLRDHLPPLAKV